MSTMPALPIWSLPPDLADILSEDGEWEDTSWDPLLLTVVGDTRHEGRHFPVSWQLSLWPSDVFFKPLNGLIAKGAAADGHGWSEVVHAVIAAADPALAERLRDDSDRSTCVIWVEHEADGRRLLEIIWRYVHALREAREADVR